MIGFKLSEKMEGKCVPGEMWYPEDEMDNFYGNELYFDIDWGPKSLIKFFNPFGKHFLECDAVGHIYIEHFCSRTPVRGKLCLNYFKDASIKYILYFSLPNPEPLLADIDYKFVGEKVNIKPWNLLTSHTTCFGTLMDSNGRLIQRSVTHFRFKYVKQFLKSFRFTFNINPMDITTFLALQK